MNCFLHPDRPAINALNIPCAPGGKIHLCADCDNEPDKLKKVWAKYKGSHAQRIELFKTPGSPRN